MAALAPLKLTQEQADRIHWHLRMAQRMATLAADRETIELTRHAIDRLARSTMALEMTRLDRAIADNMAMQVANALSLDRIVPVTDLMLALEQAARSMRPVLFATGRPTDMPLLVVVQSLMSVLEEECGEPVQIRWNKQNDRSPEGRNQVAVALIALTKLILPTASTTSVCNMVQRLRSKSAEPGPP